jgi:hypothetical protein
MTTTNERNANPEFKGTTALNVLMLHHFIDQPPEKVTSTVTPEEFDDYEIVVVTQFEDVIEPNGLDMQAVSTAETKIVKEIVVDVNKKQFRIIL